MNRVLGRMGWFTAAVVAVVAFGVRVPADDTVISIEEIMHQGHSGGKSLMKMIGNDAKASKWSDAEKKASQLAAFGEALGKNKPPKGPEDSWKTLAAEYKDNTAAIAAAVAKHDAQATADALGVLGKSCKGCHSVHKPD